jgi:NADH:ubiquinone oxidoreductase subunit F (NADH-binding)
LSYPVLAQDDDIIIGKQAYSTNAAMYDLSDPTGVNIEVSVWGTVRFPGKYRIPINTTFIDLLSYAGGPSQDSKLSDIRILRTGTGTGTKNEVIILNYNDLLFGESISTQKKINPVLQAGDVILLPEERKYTFREDISLYLPIISTLISIVTLVVTLTAK